MRRRCNGAKQYTEATGLCSDVQAVGEHSVLMKEYPRGILEKSEERMQV